MMLLTTTSSIISTFTSSNWHTIAVVFTFCNQVVHLRDFVCQCVQNVCLLLLLFILQKLQQSNFLVENTFEFPLTDHLDAFSFRLAVAHFYNIGQFNQGYRF